ncbi:MAG: hypothetical protein ABIF85_04570 [Nanoarchaeota archaeon]|nr:hypothetical protein [Nanoarchaeota archaeon]MBU4301018.1 hypothetical protein [Nanoarchaeota archaeon]MBU4452469.1 hypothetical protein [Nanoarchaeota archaeon]MCG2723999.1 hypothetical protein [archaeon]
MDIGRAMQKGVLKKIKENRKGLLHTLEATIAFMMVTGFLVFVMPHINTANSKTENIRAHVYDGLSAMDSAGTLRNLAAAENLSGIKSELNSTLKTPLKFTVGMSKSNISHGTIYPKPGAPEYINYTADKGALDSATISVNYINASDPSIYINGTLLKQHSGDYSGNEEILDISSATQTGENSLMINTTNDAKISYSLLLVESLELEKPEENINIITVGYIMSGNETTFSPKEVRVYVWG